MSGDLKDTAMYKECVEEPIRFRDGECDPNASPCMNAHGNEDCFHSA